MHNFYSKPMQAMLVPILLLYLHLIIKGGQAAKKQKGVSNWFVVETKSDHSLNSKKPGNPDQWFNKMTKRTRKGNKYEIKTKKEKHDIENLEPANTVVNDILDQAYDATEKSSEVKGISLEENILVTDSLCSSLFASLTLFDLLPHAYLYIFLYLSLSLFLSLSIHYCITLMLIHKLPLLVGGVNGVLGSVIRRLDKRKE